MKDGIKTSQIIGGIVISGYSSYQWYKGNEEWVIFFIVLMLWVVSVKQANKISKVK